MTSATIKRVLLYADGPLLIQLADAVEAAWLGLAIDRTPDGDRFACVPVSPRRLAALKLGETDLRPVFMSPEIDRRAVLFVPAAWQFGSEVTLEEVREFQPDWLPDEGFLLSIFGSVVADANRDIVVEATMRNRPIVHLNLNPPEAATGTKIDVDTLSEALALFQNVVRKGHSLAVRALSPVRRKQLAGPENYIFQAYAFAGGSFEVHMQAKADPDLFGYAPHVDALAKFDEIASKIGHLEDAIKVAQENRGHFVSAVQSLLQFVSSSKTPLTYQWTEPATAQVRENTIQPDAAEALYNALVTRQELSQQVVKLVGVFEKLDVNNKKWRLLTADGEQSGGVAPDSDVSLGGLTTMTKFYELECNDVLEEGVVSGRQTSRLELLRQPIEVPKGAAAE